MDKRKGQADEILLVVDNANITREHLRTVYPDEKVNDEVCQCGV